MSTNVLVIPEDFRTDQYVLKPIIARMMANIGVRACASLYGPEARRAR